MSRLRLGASLLPPLIAFAVLGGVWELVVRGFGIRELVLPAPSAIGRAVWDNRGGWLHDAWVTGQEAFLGFLIALAVALALAIAATFSRPVERAVLPVITVMQLIPVVALGPALVIGLGFGLTPRIVVAALITFAPLTINAIVGFQAVDRDALEVMRSVNASQREIFVKLRLPHALPYLAAATRICVGLSLIGAMVAEWQGSSEGLGYTFARAQRALATERMWASVFVLALMGVAGVVAVGVVERRLLRWQPTRSRN
jgi:NitT/TauT family transport system permease protein